MVTMESFAQAFGFDAKSPDTWTTLGKVTAVSGNTLSVKLGGSSTATDCEAYCIAGVGDIVFVVVTNGAARAVACKGGGINVIDTETTTANIITQTATQSTNYPITYAVFKSWGNVAQISITFKAAASTAADTGITLGTIVSGKRPLIRANAGSNRIMGMVESDGVVYLRTRNALNTTDSYYVCLTYLF